MLVKFVAQSNSLTENIFYQLFDSIYYINYLIAAKMKMFAVKTEQNSENDIFSL